MLNELKLSREQLAGDVRDVLNADYCSKVKKNDMIKMHIHFPFSLMLSASASSGTVRSPKSDS